MGLTKSEIFTDKQNKLASMMKALAHPARIAIIQSLIKAKSCVCGDLVDQLGLAQPTISQHLKELKNIGLIMKYSQTIISILLQKLYLSYIKYVTILRQWAMIIED